jgi:hypothetical protein
VKHDNVPYNLKLQMAPTATEYSDLMMSTKEIMFFQPRSLEDLVHFANTANYLDMAFVIDAACAAIALNWRKISKDPRILQSQAPSP